MRSPCSLGERGEVHRPRGQSGSRLGARVAGLGGNRLHRSAPLEVQTIRDGPKAPCALPATSQRSCKGAKGRAKDVPHVPETEVGDPAFQSEFRAPWSERSVLSADEVGPPEHRGARWSCWTVQKNHVFSAHPSFSFRQDAGSQ